jgi:ribosomal protein S25
LSEIPRKKDSHLFAEQYTDEAFMKAVKEAMESATVSASEVADILGCNPRYATVRLRELKDQGLLDGTMKGKAWGFRLKK